jgi:hypothetical protein
MKRRGFVFTLDAMLALLLVTLFVTSIAAITSENPVYSTYLRSQSKYVAQDTLMMLRTVPLNQIVPENVVEKWESDGTLDTSLVDPNMDPLDIVSTYWATAPIYPDKDLKHKAEIIMGYILNQTLSGYNYEMLINNYTSPYLRKVGSNYSKAFDVSPATLVMSGYAYNQTPRGYMARAFLTKIGSKITSYTYAGMYYEAPGESEDHHLAVSMNIPNENDLPDDADIIGVEWLPLPKWVNVGPYFSKMRLYIDGEGVTCGQFKADQWVDVKKWELLKDYSLDDEGTCNMLEIIHRHPNKKHVFKVEVYNPAGRYYWDGLYQYTAGIVNKYITIKYKTSKLDTFKFVHKFYFDDASAYYTPFRIGRAIFIPNRPKSIAVRIKLNNLPSDIAPVLYIGGTYIGGGTDLGNGVFEWNNATISSHINYDDMNMSYPYFIIKVGSNDGPYSLPISIDSSESYVEISYDNPIYISQYSIDITKLIDSDSIVSKSNCYYDTTFYTTFCHDVTWKYNIPNKINPLWTKFHFIVLYHVDDPNTHMRVAISNSNYTTEKVIWDSDSSIAFVGIRNGMKDTSGEVLNSAISSGSNDIHATTDSAYDINIDYSHGDYTYLVQAYAGYGDIFPLFLQGYPAYKGYNLTYYYSDGTNTHKKWILVGDSPYKDISANQLDPTKYAVDDAILRLFQKLGGDGTQSSPILVELPENVNIDLASMGQIPGLFQPIQITLRVWREG